ASGSGANGILAQSTGPDGGSAVSLSLYGTVQGGSGDAASVWIDDGNYNKFNIYEDGEVLRPESGVGLRYTGRGTTEAGYVLDVDLSGHGTVGGNILCPDASGSGAGRSDKPCRGESGGPTVLEAAALYQA